MRDLASQVSITDSHFPAILTATPTAVSVDRRGFDSVTLELRTGAGGITFTGTNKLEWVVEDSDDNSTFAAITAAAIRSGTGAAITVATGGVVEAYVAAKAAASTNHYCYVGGKRYIRATPTFGGTHATGTTVGAGWVRGHPEQAPI